MAIQASNTIAAAGWIVSTDPQKAPRYRAFLLRCWEVPSRQPGQPGTWRFQLQDADTGEKRSFADLGRLVEFLRAQFEANAGQADR